MAEQEPRRVLQYQTEPVERPRGYPTERGWGDAAWAVITLVAGLVWLVILLPVLRMMVFR